MSDILVVISRYTEDIGWVSKLQVPYLIVNKGNSIDNVNSINLPNSVNLREADTILWFLIEYYHKLPEHTIFIQANPFDHQPNIIELLTSDNILNMKEFQPLSIGYNKNIPDPKVKHIGITKFNNFEIYEGYFDENIDDIYPKYYDKGLDAIKNMANSEMDKIFLNSKMSLRQKLYSFLDIPYEKDCFTKYSFCSIFHISPNIIHRRSKEYYIRLKTVGDTFKGSGYIYERFWEGIFLSNYNIKFNQISKAELDFEIVVAHYNEDLSWLSQFNKESLIIYSKGNQATIECTNIILPNVGRESHTYLTYIIERYESLPEIIFFTQGNVTDHNIDTNYYSILSNFLQLDKNQKASKNNSFSRINAGLDNTYHVKNYKGTTLTPFINGCNEFFKKYANSSININNNINIYYCAIFSVRKEAILSRTKQYYEELLDFHLVSSSPEIAHFMERSWYYIFNLDK